VLKTTFVAVCPTCRGRFRFLLRWRGKKVKCPHCLAACRLPISTIREGEKP
jgi:hypothetical protein